jgi:hypothetical protein
LSVMSPSLSSSPDRLICDPFACVPACAGVAR